MRKFSFAVFTVFIFITSSAQDAKKFLKEGNTHLEYEHYRKAANDYKLVLKDEPKNVEALFNLGKAYLGSYRHQEALEVMEQAISISNDIDKHQDYWLGRAYHLNYKFDEAIDYYNKYVGTISKSDPRHADIMKFVLECGYAKEFVGKKTHYRIDNVGAPINTKTDEHSPIITQDGKTMMLTSRKYTEDGESENGNFSEQVLVSTKSENGKWSTPVSFEHNLDGHDATVQLYDNDSKLILYRNTGAGDLYMSELNNGKWSDPKPIEVVNSQWPEIDAYVNKDGNTMIFSSNAKSVNHDNSDLYIITKDASGSWSEPKSLGDKINTPYDETSPFISTDGKTLFFSSTGHNSMGGFDVFKSFYDSETEAWTTPVNLGYPLNTPGDDIYFYYSNEDNWSGYFSSYRRDGLGEKDIYKVTFIPNVHITGAVKDRNTGEPVQNATIQFVAEGEENAITSSALDVATGKYLVNVLADQSYSVLVQDDGGNTLGTFEYVVPILKDSDPLDYVFDIELDVQAPELITENVSEATVPEDEQIVSIDEEPIEEIEDEETDFETTDNAPSTVVKNNLVSSNETTTQVESRNTEAIPTEGAVKQAKEHFKMDDIESGCKRILHNVYFDFNKTTLQESSFDELDKLACLMSSDSKVSVEIGGYTDDVGNDDYNKALSQKRAEAVVSYLVKQGIPKNRLTAVGYGEEHPIASNDDEQDGRELNRRTEFKFLNK